jgi:hypothetical protein
MTCHRCHGFMCSADLFVKASGNGHDGVYGWRSVACGEIIDLVIVQNAFVKGSSDSSGEKRSLVNRFAGSSLFMASICGIHRELGRRQEERYHG